MPQLARWGPRVRRGRLEQLDPPALLDPLEHPAPPAPLVLPALLDLLAHRAPPALLGLPVFRAPRDHPARQDPSA